MPSQTNVPNEFEPMVTLAHDRFSLVYSLCGDIKCRHETWKLRPQSCNFFIDGAVFVDENGTRDARASVCKNYGDFFAVLYRDGRGAEGGDIKHIIMGAYILTTKWRWMRKAPEKEPKDEDSPSRCKLCDAISHSSDNARDQTGAGDPDLKLDDATAITFKKLYSKRTPDFCYEQAREMLRKAESFSKAPPLLTQPPFETVFEAQTGPSMAGDVQGEKASSDNVRRPRRTIITRSKARSRKAGKGVVRGIPGGYLARC